MSAWLVDTGPFVAYISRNDPWHARVAARVDAFTGQFVTTGAVVTEVMYFLSDTPGGPAAFGELLLAARVQITSSTQPADVVAAAALMDKYADTPMDYADATLVLLAHDIGVLDILTLDRRGFSTYRTPKGKAFRLVLSPSP
jgi:uncharacterized protein